MKYSKEPKYIRTWKIVEGKYGVFYGAKDQKGQKILALKKIRLQAEEEGIPSTIFVMNQKSWWLSLILFYLFLKEECFSPSLQTLTTQRPNIVN